MFYDYDLIDHINERIKSKESISKKMTKKGIDFTYSKMIENINDIAGVRVICPLKKDIYTIRKLITNLPGIKILKEKDYITNPKKSGYSSYHMILEVPVTLSKNSVYAKVEVQIRTMAMDFWASLEHKMKYKNNKERSRIRKMRNNLFSPSQPINHSVSERVSLSASTRLEKLFRNKRKGSVTVEAAATVPLFFLAVVTLLYLLEMMAVHTAVRSSLQYAGKQAAKDTCITQMLMPSKVERDVVYAIGETRMERSIIAGGSSGMDCSASRMSVRTGIGTLNAEYQVKIPVPVFGIRPVKCRETMKIKAWSGYEKEGLSDMGNDTVYVTENGLVYHKDYHCSYLDLSIRMTHMGTVSDLRNESGGRYYPCEHCMKGNAGTIYITNFGDRYHSSLSCSGLKRTIYAIPVSEAAGKGACSKCGR